MFIDFKGRGREREKNINVREKNLLVASHTHFDQGSNQQSFIVQDDAPTNWAKQILLAN